MLKNRTEPDTCAKQEEHFPRESDRLANASSLWVIIPAYNEARSITNVVVSLRSEGYTVVVVDDGSADETGDLARSAGAIVLQHCQNLGQGGALWTRITFSLQEAGVQLICTFDADGQHCVEDVRRMWECLTENDADVVLGSRVFLAVLLGSLSHASFYCDSLFYSPDSNRVSNVTDAHNGLRLMRASSVQTQLQAARNGSRFRDYR